MTTVSIKSQRLGSLVLVTGPARSGKSDWAESLAVRSEQPVLYIATSNLSGDDLEWQARIQAHRDRRPLTWITWEVPDALSASLRQVPDHHCILVDSLGTWLANHLDQPLERWQQTQSELLEVLKHQTNSTILVAEEVGWGLVPAYPAGRLFRDRLGELVRHIGVLADQVYLVTAGYALDLKQLGQPVIPDIQQHQDVG